MATAIGGNNTGVVDGSLYLLNRDDQTREGVAGHGEQLYVNVTNGNLVIQHVDAYLPSQGEDYGVVRTYNSRGNWNEGVGTGWILSSPVELTQITKNTILFKNADGAEYVFNYDSARDVYLSVDGVGAYETITIDKTTKEYTLVKSDQTVLAFTNNGILKRSTDTNGNTITYQFASSKLVQVIDDTGHTIDYIYGGSQGSELSSIVDSELGVLVSYTYDQGRLLTVTDRNGDVTTYAYYTDGTLKSVTLPQNATIQADAGKARVISFDYDSDPTDNTGKSQLLNTIWDAEGNPTSFDYQFYVNNTSQYDGGETRMVNSLGIWRAESNDAEYVQWRMENGYYQTYDALTSNVTQVNEIKANHSTWFEFDASGDITLVGNAKNTGGNVHYDYATRYVYDTNDNLTEIIDANAYAIQHSDDQYWRDMRMEAGYVDINTGEGLLAAQLTATQLNELAELYTTHLAYDNNGNLTSRIDNEDNLTTLTYTSFNKISSETSAMGHALTTSNEQFYQDKRVELGYVADASLLSATDTADILALHTSSYVYDSNQNLTEIRTPGGDLTTFAYDSFGNVTNKTVYLDASDLVDPAKQQVTLYSYDAYGNNISTIEANAWSITNSDETYWQALRQEFGVIDGSGAGKLVADLIQADIDLLTNKYTSSNTYDLFGNRTSYTDPNGGVTTYLYDNDNRLISVSTPESNTTAYAYDSVGNRIGVTDANGHSTIYVYDRNNMLISVQDWTTATGLGADDRTTTYKYDVVGNGTSVTDANGVEITYVYREDNRLVEILTPYVDDVNGVAVQYSTTYAYDAVGRRISINDNNGNVTDYIYNQSGLLKETTDPIGHVTQYSYDANLNQVQIIIGAQLAEAMRRVLRFSYDEENQLIAEVDAEGGVTHYGYDTIGNRIQVTDALGRVYDFQYDLQNRQIIETKPEVADPITGLPVRYTVVHYFDGNTNRIANTDENGNTTHVSFDDDNRAILIEDANGIKTAYTYDGNNNQTSVAIGVDAYIDTNNNLIVTNDDQAQTTSYAYDEFNQVVSKVDGLGNALAESDDALYVKLRTELGYVDGLGGGKLVADLSVSEQAALKALYTERYAYDRNGNYLQTINNAGNATDFTYDTLNRLVAQADSLGNATSYSYDGNGNQVKLIDSLGRVSALSYDANDRLINTVDALGVTTNRTYDDFGNLLTETRANGTLDARTTQYQYDLNNRVTDLIDAEAHQLHYEYDAVGNRLSVTDAKGFATQYVYDALNRSVQIIDPLTFSTIYDYDGVGNRIALTDANGGITRFEYDAGNRRIETTDAEGRVTQFAYDVRGNRVVQTTAAGIVGEEQITTYEYDAENNLRAVVDANGNRTENEYDSVYNRVATTDGNGHTTTYAFDAINRQIQVTDALGNSTNYLYDAVSNRTTVTDALGRVRTFAYDDLNRVITETAADSVETTYAYDAVSNRIAITSAANTAAAATTSFVYDKDDQLVSQTDALGNTTSYVYDANHNQTSVTDANGNTTVYSLDSNNRVATITDAKGNVTSYAYDANGNRVQVIDNNGGTTTTYYNANNEVINRVDALGYITNYQYDSNGNLVTQTLSATALSVPVDPNVTPTPTVSTNDQVVAFEYDSVNNLVGRIDGEGFRTEYVYDAVGNRLETRQQVDLGGAVYAVTSTFYNDVNNVSARLSAEGYLSTFDYDAVGNRTSSTGYNIPVSAPIIGGAPIPAIGDVGRTISFIYDANNRVVSETSALGVTTAYSYDDRGNRVTLTDAQGSADERTTVFAYDSINRLTDITNALGIITHYEYDSVGNNTQRQDAYASANERTTTFIYDQLNRVVTETSALNVTTSFVYDGSGNVLATILAEGVVGVERTLLSEYDLNNQLIAEVNGEGERTEYVYDAAGNYISTTQAPGIIGLERTNTFEYDLDNRVTASVDALGVRTEYAYDGAGNKVQTIQAVGLSEQRVSAYSYDLDNQLIQVIDPEGGVTQYTYDALGNQVQIIDANGGVVTNTFDAVGKILTNLSAGGVLTSNAYDARGNNISTTQSFADSSDSRTTTYQYNLLDQQIIITDARDFSTVITYDEFGNQVSIVNGQYLVDSLDASYDAQKAASVHIVASTFEFDNASRMTAVIDNIGTRTEYIYDEVGNRTQVIEEANRAIPKSTIYTYDLANRQLTTVNPEGGTTLNTYDALGNKIEDSVLQSVDNLNAETWIIKQYEYDANGNLMAEVDPYGTRTELQYDAMGNQTTIKFATGSAEERTVFTEYDFNNRITADIDAEGNQTSYTYDSMGNRLSVTDALGRVAYFVYDGGNNLTSVTDPEGNATNYHYDSAGNQTEVSIGSRVTAFEFDGVGNISKRIEADNVETRYTYDSANNMVKEELFADAAATVALSTVSYVYDTSNRLSEQVDVDGTVTTFVYDYANNITSRSTFSATDSAGARTSTFEYDLNNRKITDIFDATGLNFTQYLEYDALGNVITNTNANGVATQLVYDLNNQVLSETIDAGGLDLVKSYSYDAVGNVIAVTDARGNTTDYVYNDNNQRIQIIQPLVTIYSIADGESLERPTANLVYDAAGNVVKETAPNGVSVTRYYDGNNRIVAEIDGHNALREYTYNAQGDQVELKLYMTRLSDADQNPSLRPAPPAGEVRITTNIFDVAGRLIQTNHPATLVTTLTGTDTNTPVATTQSISVNETWSYDVFGNQVEYFDKNGNRNVYYYDLAGNMTASVDGEGYLTEWDYDSQGNVLQQRKYSTPININTVDTSVAVTAPVGNVDVLNNVYDNASRLIEERTPFFDVYNPLNPNVPLSQQPVTQFTYDANNNQITKTVAAGTSSEYTEYSYYDADNNLIAVINGERVLHLYSYDQNGNLTKQERLYNKVPVSVVLSSLNSNSDFRALVTADASNDQATTFSFDAMNRTVSETDLMGAGSADDLTRTYKYDATQLRTFSQDEEGHITQYEYSGLGVATLTITPDGGGSVAEYDAAGNQISGFMGQVANQTAPATNITASIGNVLSINWDLSGAVAMGSRVVYGTTSQSTTSGYTSQTGLINSWNDTSATAAINIASLGAGDTLYFRVVTQDLAGNTSWTEEKSISIPPRITDVLISQATPNSITVTANFEGGAQSPVLLYGAVQNSNTPVNFVLQGNGSYEATISGITNAEDLAFKIQWQDTAGATYTSNEQGFTAQGSHTAITSTINEGTVNGGTGTAYVMDLVTQIPQNLGQNIDLVMAEWRLVGETTGYSSTANSGVLNNVGTAYAYDLTLGSSTSPLDAGAYDVIITGITSTGESIILDTLVYEVGTGAPAPLTSESVSLDAPAIGNSQLVIVDGVRVDTARQGDFATFDVNAAGTQSYSVFYSNAFAEAHDTSVTSTAQTQTIVNPDTTTVIITGYDLDVSAVLSAAEIANISGGVTLSSRVAGSGLSFTDSQIMTVSGNTLTGGLSNVAAGQYDIKISYTDTNGNEVVVDWYRADTTVASDTITETSQTLLGAEERNGSITLNPNGNISVEAGLYLGDLTDAGLNADLALLVANTGLSGGSLDTNGSITGYFTQIAYNALDQIISDVSTDDGLYREYGLDGNGNRVATYLYGNVGSTNANTSYTDYDARDRTVAQFDAAFIANGDVNAEHPVTRFAYNYLNLVVEQSDALSNKSYTDGLDIAIYTEYNTLGKKVSTTDASGAVTTYQYDILGNEVAVTDALGKTATKTYDSFGRVTSETNGAGNVINYGYDSLGRQTSLTKGGTDTITYNYDQRDRMTDKTDALGGITRFEYDGRDFQTWVYDARYTAGNTTSIYKYGQQYDVMGQITASYSYQNGQLVTEQHVYDFYGNVVAETDGEGRANTTVYEGFGRVAETVDEDGYRIVKEYDDYGRLTREYTPTSSKDIRYTYDANGNQTSITDLSTGVSTTSKYNLLGQLVSEIINTPIDAQGESTHNRQYTNTYDSRGNLVRWSDSVTNMHLNYSYDEAGNLQWVYTDVGYDPDGLNTSSDPSFRAVNHWYSYDNANRIASITNGQGGTIINEYSYDNKGNRVFWSNEGNGVNYTFDANARVTASSWYVGTDHHEQKWQYDDVGNVLDYRTFKNGTQDEFNIYRYYENNTQYYSQTKDNTTTSNFDLSGRLTSKKLSGDSYTINYQYNYFADGREKSVSATGDSGGSSSFGYNANLQQNYVNLGKGSDQNRAEVSTFVYDNGNHIIYKWNDTGKGVKTFLGNSEFYNSKDTHEIKTAEYVYANGNAVGETANTIIGGKVADGGEETKETLLDVGGYSLVKNIGDSYPSTSVTLYTVNDGDTVQSIANAIYGNPSLWFVIAAANGLTGSELLDAGRQLQVPNTVQSGRLTSETHALYSESDIIGSTLPNLQSAGGGGGGGCAGFLAIVIVIAIAIIAPYAVAALAGALTATLGTVAAYAIAGAVVYAAANIIQQGLLIAIGVQESFDWGQVGTAAVSGLFAGAAQGVQVNALDIAKKTGEVSQYAKVASSALKVASVAAKQYLTDGKITNVTGLLSAGIGQYLSFGKAAADAASAAAKTSEAANIADKAAESISDIQTIVDYATPWVQLAESYVRNDGELSPQDWAGAVASTLSTAVTDKGAGASDIQNAVNRVGVNLLVAGALSQSSAGAAGARDFLYNSIGNEVGQFIGNGIGKFIASGGKSFGFGDFFLTNAQKSANSGQAVFNPETGKYELGGQSVAASLPPQQESAMFNALVEAFKTPSLDSFTGEEILVAGLDSPLGLGLGLGSNDEDSDDANVRSDISNGIAPEHWGELNTGNNNITDDGRTVYGVIEQDGVVTNIIVDSDAVLDIQLLENQARGLQEQRALMQDSIGDDLGPREQDDLGLIGLTAKFELSDSLQFGFELNTSDGFIGNLGNRQTNIGLDTEGRVTSDAGLKAKVDPIDQERASVGIGPISITDGRTVKLSPGFRLGSAGVKAGPQVGFNMEEGLNRVVEPVARPVRNLENVVQQLENIEIIDTQLHETYKEIRELRELPGQVLLTIRR